MGINCILCEYYVKVGEYVIFNAIILYGRKVNGFSKNCFKLCVFVCCMFKYDYFKSFFLI